MIIDVNVNLSRWPFRRLPCDELPRLIERLRKWKVRQAWVGSFDALLHRDIGGVNARLAGQCKAAPKGMLVPFGSVNPTLPDWTEDLRRCAEDYRMAGIRLHPNYHGYTLDDPRFAKLLSLAAERKLIVQLAPRMEDIRTQHHLMQVADVDMKPLAALVAARPGLRLVVLNGLRTMRDKQLQELTAAGAVYFEIAMLESVAAISRLLGRIPPGRLLFGSYFPFFQLESAILKLRESELEKSQIEAISYRSAEQLLQAKAARQ